MLGSEYAVNELTDVSRPSAIVFENGGLFCTLCKNKVMLEGSSLQIRCQYQEEGESYALGGS